MRIVLLLALSFGCKSTNKPDSPKKDSSNKAIKSAKKPVKTPQRPILEQEILYRAGKTQMKGYLAYPKDSSRPAPGILVVHEWWGHNEYVRKRARMLARLGYVAFAVDMYGDGKSASHPKEAMAFATAIRKNMDSAKERFQAALTLLKEHDATNDEIAAIGYCFGGGVVLHMARVGVDLEAVASFHGGLKPHEKDGEAIKASKVTKAKILVLHGEADPLIKPEDVEAFKQEMKDSGVTMTFVSYPDAKHAFTNPAATEVGKKFDMPVAYDEEADKKSWQELKRFLAENLQK